MQVPLCPSLEFQYLFPTHSSAIMMLPVAEPSQEILSVKNTFAISASKHHDIPLPVSEPTTTFFQKSQLDPLSYGAGIPPPRSKHSELKTPLDGAQPPNLIGRFKNWCRNLTHIPNPSPQKEPLSLNGPLSLNKEHYESVITISPKGSSYPLYNLDAKLGKRDGHNSIEFLCSAASSNTSSFRQITLEVQLFQLGNVNSEYHEIVPRRIYSISDKPRAPITALQFHPLRPQRSNQAQVLHNFTKGANATLGGGGPGVNASLGIAAVSEYARDEGVSFDGKRSGPSKLTWLWRAGDCVASGLEDPCEFWVTIPPVKKGVKADFKVTCLVSSRRWGYKKITLPEDKKKPVHELELHFT